LLRPTANGLDGVGSVVSLVRSSHREPSRAAIPTIANKVIAAIVLTITRMNSEIVITHGENRRVLLKPPPSSRLQSEHT
jgi:hypothetical protein